MVDQWILHDSRGRLMPSLHPRMRFAPLFPFHWKLSRRAWTWMCIPPSPLSISWMKTVSFGKAKYNFVIIGIIERIEQEIHNLLTECRTRDNTGIRMNLNDDHLTMNLNDSFARGQLHNAQRKRKATGQQQQQTLFIPKFITKGIVARGPSASSSTTKSPKVAPKNVCLLN